MSGKTMTIEQDSKAKQTDMNLERISHLIKNNMSILRKNKSGETIVKPDSKIELASGGFECPFCGSRDVAKADKNCRTCSASFSRDHAQEKKERSASADKTVENLTIAPFFSAGK